MKMRICVRCGAELPGELKLTGSIFSAHYNHGICEDCAKKVKPYTCARCGRSLNLETAKDYGICDDCDSSVLQDIIIAESLNNVDRLYKEALVREGKLDPKDIDFDSGDSKSSTAKTYPTSRTTSSSTSTSASSTGSGCSKGVIKFFVVLAVIALVVSMVIGFIKNGGLSIDFGSAIKFMTVAMDPPEEYYGVSVEGQNNGWVAAFELDSGLFVCCGEDPNIGTYYIMDGLLYVVNSDGQWELRNDIAGQEEEERLLSRHLHTVLDLQYSYKSGEAWADGNGMTHTFDNDHQGGVISVNSDGKITMYAARLNGDCAFDLKDYDFTQLKETAMQILAETTAE